MGEEKENGPVFVRILRERKEEAVNQCEIMCVMSVYVCIRQCGGVRINESTN